ncbi:unnamed protein product [Orchesella dallaii]|uniref:C2H2-type domain-containing protein n=1 Tax=Orchesella dallaii TaxID=48710 RepID=A0ABP1S4K1_9HEXA
MDSKPSNHLCFVCYKPAVPKHEESQSANSSENQFLLLLSRHLKIQPDLNKFKNEFICCEDCALLGNSFCSVYFQLECLQLQLNWKVTTIFETMLSAGRVASRVNAFRAQFEIPRIEGDYGYYSCDEKSQQIFSKILETRKVIMKGCKLKMNSSKPRVLLERIPENWETPTEIKRETLSPEAYYFEGQVPDFETQSDVDSRAGFELGTHDGDASHLSSCPPPQDEKDNLDYENIEDHDEISNTVDDDLMLVVSEIKIEQIDEQDIPNDNKDEPILTENLHDSINIKEETNSPVFDTPKKSWRSLLQCPKCSELFTTQGKMDTHFKLHEENLIPDENLSLDCNLVIKEEQDLELVEDERENESEQDHSDVDMERCPEKEEEEEMPSASIKPEGFSSNFTRRDPNLPFTQCEICLVHYDCEAAVEKCRVVNHNIKKYVCCHSCRRYLSCHYLLVQHRTIGTKCFTKNPKDLEPAAAPQFPRLKGTPIIGSKFCPVEGCYEVFRYGESLKIHGKTHGNWECTFCQAEFGKAHELAWHEVSEHNKPSVKEEPDSYEAQTEEISKKKLKTAGKSLSCTRCDKKYEVKSRLISHFLCAHLGIPKTRILELKSECEICKFPFGPTASKKVIKEHIKTQHAVEDMDPTEVSMCTICQAPFRFWNQMSIHMELVHKLTSEYKCAHCQKTDFPNRRAYKRHVYCSHKDKNDKIECEMCQRKFSKKRHLNQHLETVHKQPKSSRPWPCEQCEKKFKKKAELDRHAGTVHMDPSKRKFVCLRKGCGKRCWSSQKLREHIKKHTKRHRFACPFCGETYKFRKNLRIHLAKVHGESVANTLPKTKPYSKSIKIKVKEKELVEPGH